MRKTRLVLIPGVKSLDTIGCLLLFLACPSIAFKGQENREVDTICKAQNLKEFWIDSPWPGDTENIGWVRGFGGGNWPGKSQQNTCSDHTTRSAVRSGRSDERRVQVRREIARDDGVEIRRIRLDNGMRETRMRVDLGKIRDSRRLSGEERRQDSRRVHDDRRESTSLDREMRFRSAENRIVTNREVIDARRSSRASTRQEDRETRMKREVRETENIRASVASDPTSLARRIVSNRETIDLMRRDSRLSIRSSSTKSGNAQARNIESRRNLGASERAEPRISDERRSMGSRRLSEGMNGRVSSRSLEREIRSEGELASRRDQRTISERERSAERRVMKTREDARREFTSSIRSLNRELRSEAAESRLAYNRDRADSDERTGREDGSQFRGSRRTSERQREMNDGRVSNTVDREVRSKREATERRELSQRRSGDIGILRESRMESRRETENRRNNRFSTQYLNRQIRSGMEARELQQRKISRERESRGSDDSSFERRIASRGQRVEVEDFRQSAAIEREARMMRDSRESRRSNSLNGDRRVNEQSERDSRLTRSLERVSSTGDNRIDISRSVRDEIRYPAQIQRSTRSVERMRVDRADIRRETERSEDRREMERESRNDRRHHDRFLGGRDERRIHDHVWSQRAQGTTRSTEDISRSEQIRLTRAGREQIRRDTRRTAEERDISRVDESNSERISRRMAIAQRVDIRRERGDARYSVLSRKARNEIRSADIRTHDRFADVRQGDRVIDNRRNGIERETRNSVRIGSERLSRQSTDIERADIRRVREDTRSQTRVLREARSLEEVTRFDRQIPVSRRETTRLENSRSGDESLSRNSAGTTPERRILSERSSRRVGDIKRADIRRVRDDTRSQTRLLREARSLEEVTRFDRQIPVSRRETTRVENRRSGDEAVSRNRVRSTPERQILGSDRTRDTIRTNFERSSRRVGDVERADIRRVRDNTRSQTRLLREARSLEEVTRFDRQNPASRRETIRVENRRSGDETLSINRARTTPERQILSERSSRRVLDIERAEIRRVREDTRSQTRVVREARSLEEVTRFDRQIPVSRRETTRVENRRSGDETLSRHRASTTPERQILGSDRTIRDTVRTISERSSRQVGDIERADIRRVRDETRSQSRLLRKVRSLEEVTRFDRRMPSAESRRETTRVLNRQNGDETLSRNLAKINPEGIRKNSMSQVLPQQRNIRNAIERWTNTDRDARRIVRREAERENKEMRRIVADIRRTHKEVETRRILQEISLKIDSIRTFPKETRRSDRQRHAVNIDRDMGRFVGKRLDNSLSIESFRRLPETNEPTMKPQRSNIRERYSGKTNNMERELDVELMNSAKNYDYFHESPKNALASWLTADLRTDLNGIAETLMYGGIACFALFSNVNKKAIF